MGKSKHESAMVCGYSCLVVPTKVAPSKVDPWSYRPFEIELGKLPRYSQPHKSVEFKLNSNRQ